jgi:glycosyltransferase involved in cell wall biosynthesis
MDVEKDSLLLVLPVAFRRDRNGNLLFEAQACNGLERWADHFPRLVIACPLEMDIHITPNKASVEYLEIDQIQSRDRMEFVPLPWAYELGTFLSSYGRTRRLLAETIRQCQYLSFAMGGLVGDWASIAALEAIRQKRRFSIWCDRVEHQVIRSNHLDDVSLKRVYRKLKNNWIVSPLMERLEHHIIKRCDLGLFHGRDCFDAYAHYCRSPHLVHNIHLKPEDRIAELQLQEKIHRVSLRKPLRLLYAGRAAGMKGPLDWVQIMAELYNRGITFHACWMGDGPLLADMRAEVTRLGLSNIISLPGFVSDRAQLMQAIRDSDLFVFCHKTPESPRCLIEALMSGTPIIGYENSYSRDLLGTSADQLLVPFDHVTELTERILDLNTNRELLCKLIKQCYELGEHYSDYAVFQHRSNLLKEYT